MNDKQQKNILNKLIEKHTEIMERFTITRVSNKDVNKLRNEFVLNVENLNGRRNSKTVPVPDRRKISLAQLTR